MNTHDNLTDTYTAWIMEQNLPLESADELILTEGLSATQIKWLKSFLEKWDAVS